MISDLNVVIMKIKILSILCFALKILTCFNNFLICFDINYIVEKIKIIYYSMDILFLK